MTKISYQSKDGRLAGVATFYELPLNKYLHDRRSIWGTYSPITVDQKFIDRADKKAAQFNKLLNSKKLNLTIT